VITAASAPATGRSSTSFAPSTSVDPPWSSSRTSQLSLLESLSTGNRAGDANIRSAISDQNYQSWVTSSRTRSSSLRQMLAQRISASASGSWPTSRAEDSESCGNHGAASDPLNAVARQWATPNATPDNSTAEAADGRAKRAREKYDAGEYAANSRPPSMNNLSIEVQKWGTPRAADASEAAASHEAAARGFVALCQQASNWPTPDLGGGTNQSPSPNAAVRPTLATMAPLWMTPEATLAPRKSSVERKANGAVCTQHGQTFAEQSENWNTPTTEDGEKGDDGPKSLARRMAGEMKQSDRRLRNQVQGFSRLDPATDDGPASSENKNGSRPRLNPAFAAWLMGLPWWWTNPGVTSSARSAMAAYRSALRSRLRCLLATCWGMR